MKLFKHIIRTMDQNVYFYYDEDTMECVIIDPGSQARKLMKLVEEKGLKVVGILLTHGHGDHMGAIPEIREKYDWPVYAHDWEVDVLKEDSVNLSSQITGKVEIEPDRILQDGDIIKVGSAELHVLHTPGHTVGGVCYYSPVDQIVFVGDTLFYGSVGRVDFPNPPVRDGKGYDQKENFDRMLNSIKNKLYKLPDDVVVYPGHGSETRIGFERKYNPFVKG